jgi:antitoxin ParD1/3/4
MGKIEKISVSLPAEMVKAVNRAVDSGNYASVSEVVRTALRRWESEQAESDRLYQQAVKTYGLERLRQMVQEGIDSGPGIDIDEAFGRVRARLKQKWGEGNGGRKAVAGRSARSR